MSGGYVTLKTTIIGLLCLFSWTAFGQLTLEGCQEKARANYPLIKQYELIDKTREFTISNANKAYLPQLSITAIEGYLINGFPSFTPGAPSNEGKFNFIGIAQLNQNIWDGGATRVEKKIAGATAEVDRRELDVMLYSIQDRVNQLFFGVLLIDEQTKQLTILRSNLEKNLVNIKESADNGLAYNSDVDEVKAEILKLDQRGTEFMYTRKAYTRMLALMTAMPVLDGAVLDKPMITLPSDSAAIRRPELSLYDTQSSLVKTRNELNKVGYMPKVGIIGIGVRIEPGINLGPQPLQSLSLAGLSVSWNTAGLYRAKNSRAISSINLERIQRQRETFLLNTHVQVQQVLAEIEKSNELIKKDEEIIRLKEGIRKAYEVKYNNGVCSMNDLIRVINNESEARSIQSMHEIQRLISATSFKTISGN